MGHKLVSYDFVIPGMGYKSTYQGVERRRHLLNKIIPTHKTEINRAGFGLGGTCGSNSQPPRARYIGQLGMQMQWKRRPGHVGEEGSDGRRRVDR